MIEVLSLGAGVQSSTVMLMSCLSILPKLDAAIFADTQWEPKSVYHHLEYLQQQAKNANIPLLIRTRGDLRADAIEFRRNGGKGSGGKGHRRFASMPLFVKNPDGTVGMINRQCTTEYKIEVIEKTIRQELLGLKKGQKAPKDAARIWIGISYDEIHRRRSSRSHWHNLRYPLIDDIKSPKKDTLRGRGFDRRDCLNWLSKNNYPKPPKSACIGCPYHNDLEWLRMKTHDPEAWADAVAFDKEIRRASALLIKEKMVGRLIGLPYIHRSCRPLDEVIFDHRDRIALKIYGMGNECQGMCGV